MTVAPSASAIDHAAFDDIVMRELPDVAATLDPEDRELLHTEMAAVARATSQAIERGDADAVGRHFAIMERVFLSAAPAVDNAIHVSYLENVFLGENRPNFLIARQNLPPRLARGLVELEQHFEGLAKSAKDI